MFIFDDLSCFFPIHAKGRIGKHIIKFIFTQTIHDKGVAKLYIGGILPLDKHIRLTNGVGFRINLLPEHFQLGIGVKILKMLFTNRKHSTRATGRIIKRFDNACLGQGAKPSRTL